VKESGIPDFRGCRVRRLPDLAVYYESGGGRPSPAAILRPPMVCDTCQKDDREVTLHKCPICFKMVCVECARKEYGRLFCSQRCAHLFFFGDDED
jgi:hypothetical protein